MLDVACGGGDVLITLARWAAKAGLDIELAGCDASREAVDLCPRASGEGRRARPFFELKIARDLCPTATT